MKLSDLKYLLRPINNRIKNVVVRGILRTIDDGTGIQSVKLEALKGEVRDKIERMQQYGFTSVPVPGSECSIICLGGVRDHMIVIVSDDRKLRKKNMLPGESAQYNGVTGDFLHLGADGRATVKATATVHLGSETAADPVVRMSDLAALAATFNAHTHPVPSLALVNAVPLPPEDPEEEPSAPATGAGTTATPTVGQAATGSSKVMVA